MSLLRRNEFEIKQKALKKKAEAEAKVKEFEQLELERQSKIDAMKKDYTAKLNNYQWRCTSYWIDQDPFYRLALFMGHYGSQISRIGRDELMKAAKECHLEEIIQLINETGSKSEQPPKQPDYDVLGEE